MRIGHGYDVHRLVEGRKLIMGGVEIPYEKGLLGHSDADVLAHAIMDALLGAAALGDIGKLFPDNDPAFEGADSMKLMARVVEVLAEKGWRTCVADGSVVMENLMLAAHALGIGSCWINRAKEVFETEEGKEILRAAGIEGEYEGVGHCILGYADCDAPNPAPRKENYVYWVE